MPKSKVTKTDLYEGVTRTPVKVKQTKTPVVWLTIMGVCLVLGLAWIIMYYLVAGRGVIPFVDDLGAWNYLIAFGLMIIGLLMTLRWR